MKLWLKIEKKFEYDIYILILVKYLFKKTAFLKKKTNKTLKAFKRENNNY